MGLCHKQKGGEKNRRKGGKDTDERERKMWEQET